MYTMPTKVQVGSMNYLTTHGLGWTVASWCVNPIATNTHLSWQPNCAPTKLTGQPPLTKQVYSATPAVGFNQTWVRWLVEMAKYHCSW